jgi:hypothetical protein
LIILLLCGEQRSRPPHNENNFRIDTKFDPRVEQWIQKRGNLMKRSFPRPKWFSLYLFTFLYLGAFWLVLKAEFSESGRIWAEASLTGVYFVLVLAWLNANETAMWLEDRERRELSRLEKAPSASRVPDRPSEPSADWGRDFSDVQPLLHRFSRLFSAWLIALVTNLGEFFQGLH